MRQTKTLPLITVIEWISLIENELVQKKEECTGERARADKTMGGRAKPNR